MNVRLLYCPNPSYLQRGESRPGVAACDAIYSESRPDVAVCDAIYSESRPGVADSKYCVVSDAFLRDEGFVGLNGSNEPQNPCKATPA
jgi:hypothetical protein